MGTQQKPLASIQAQVNDLAERVESIQLSFDAYVELVNAEGGPCHYVKNVVQPDELGVEEIRSFSFDIARKLFGDDGLQSRQRQDDTDAWLAWVERTYHSDTVAGGRRDKGVLLATSGRTEREALARRFVALVDLAAVTHLDWLIGESRALRELSGGQGAAAKSVTAG